MVELKTATEVGAMAVTGAFIAELLDDLAGRAQVGVNLLDLEQRARELIAERGAQSCYWDYDPSFGRGPFRNVICLSVNDAVLHGLPHDYVLRDGDLLSMDIAVSIDGWVADSARSIIVGTPRPEDQRIIEATEHALAAGIGAARPTFDTCGSSCIVRPGLTLALEPWLAQGTNRIVYDPDGWTIRSADRSRAAHSEHTIAITDGAARVLTALPARRRPSAESECRPPSQPSAACTTPRSSG